MSTRRIVLFASLLYLLTPSAKAWAETSDQSLSPYFFVSGDPGVDTLALSATQADVNIAGVIADVVVTQHYTNQGDKAINARYVFPASTRAAVYGMKMTVGNRSIEAKIKKRAQARAEYETAKREGKSASLLEQDRPNVFTMNVANILPGDKIRVELRYTELIVPTDGVYEMVYPTVVGPRYASEEAAPAGAQHAHAPYTKAGDAAKHKVTLSARIAAGMPVYDIKSPSHTIATQTGEGHAATVQISDRDAGNRDFILRYRLSSSEIASGLMLYEGAEENFFLMMVQPPRRPKAEVIPPREYVFVVDVSGSMHGHPLDVTGELMQELFSKLRPDDRFNVLLFAGGSSLLSETSLKATEANIDSAVALITSTQGAGSTQLLPALQRALALPSDRERSRSFVIVTDGYITAEREAFDLVRKNLGRANVFAFGIGSSVNRNLIEGLAKAGLGVPFVANSDAEARGVAAKFRAYIESPVLTKVSVKYDGFEVYDQQPAAIPDVFANRPVVVFGKWKGSAAGTIELTGVSGRGRFVNKVKVSDVTRSPSNGALQHLWARSRIADLSDFGTPSSSDEEEITRLGLKYSLLTQYTSFIAVHNVVRNAAKDATDVDVALAMPEGVSDLSVGITSGPEPELTWLLLWMLSLALFFSSRRRRSWRRGPS